MCYLKVLWEIRHQENLFKWKNHENDGFEGCLQFFNFLN